MKKVLLTLMALLMSVTLAGCSKPKNDAPVIEGGLTKEEVDAIIAADENAKEKAGFNEYEKLYREADAITDDLDARYEAFAKADAYLVDKALFIPGSQQSRSLIVSKIVPYSHQYSGVGLAEYKYKGMRLQNEIVTLDQYNEATAKWQSGSGLETPTVAEYDGPREWTEATSREVQTMDYNVTALATDHELNTNFIDGLTENNSYGNIVPSIAESWESNEDKTVWTFHIRKGVQWVTNLGEPYGAEVTAHDFVTGVRHGAEFESGTGPVLFDAIDGYSDYYNNKVYTDEAWDKVGVKALDDYTLQFSTPAKLDENGEPVVDEEGNVVRVPVPYFDSMTLYATLYPLNEEFLVSKGEGCKLGSPDKESCEFGTASADSILYNGAYIMEQFDVKSSTVLVANPLYWDADHQFLTKITRIYDEGQDPYAIIKGFETGTYMSAGLNTSWSDYDKYYEKYKNNAYPSLVNPSVFGCVFNFNRQAYEYTSHETEEDRVATREAILNTNFRKALRAAWDKTQYLETVTPHEVAVSTLRNINNFPPVVLDSHGTIYGDLVTKAYQEMTGDSRSLADEQDSFYSPEDAMKYVEAAKAEGVKFPITLDMLVIETSDKLLKQSQSFKASVEESTQGNILINLVLEDADTVQRIAYLNTDPAASDYDISTFTGWSPDYADPKSFVDIYSPTSGYYMCPCGLLDNNSKATLLAQVTE